MTLSGRSGSRWARRRPAKGGRSGGTGRRDGLKIRFSKGSVGSSPSSGTNKLLKLLVFFIQVCFVAPLLPLGNHRHRIFTLIRVAPALPRLVV